MFRSGLLGKADPFTETVTTRGDRKLYRARFAGLLAGRWQSGPWEAPVTGLSLTLSEIQDVAGTQLGLFPSAAPPRTETDLVRQWRVRFGAERLRRAHVVKIAQAQGIAKVGFVTTPPKKGQ